MGYNKLCETCDHKYVCKFTDVVKDVQGKINSTDLTLFPVTLGTETYAHDLDYIKATGKSPVFLSVGCIYRNATPVTNVYNSPESSTGDYLFNGHSYTTCSSTSTVVKDTGSEYAPSDTNEAKSVRGTLDWHKFYGERFVVSKPAPWFMVGSTVICVQSDPVRPFVIAERDYDCAFEYKPITNVPLDIIDRQIKDGTYVHSIPIEYLVPVNE